MVTCLLSLLIAAAPDPAGVNLLDHFVPGEDALWAPLVPGGMRISPHYIAPPLPGQDHGAWLAAMREYREGVRAGTLARVMRLDFKGVRAWMRLDDAVATVYGLRPGDQLEIRCDARRLAGQGALCVAFDLRDRATGAWAGWSGVVEALTCPADGEWHTLSKTVVVPEFDARATWARPIVGMDATQDARPRTIEIRRFELRVADKERMQAVTRAAVAGAAPGPLDRSIYDRSEMAWASGAFTCHFTFMYDRSFYDPERGYTLEALLEDGVQAFGGYDILVLWQGYPRLGFDDRNQFDMYREMPGGLNGLREVVRRAHARGVRVFIDYNPWDTGTRREERSDEDALAELVAAIEADGIFLDTMAASSRVLREKLDAARAGVVLAPEGHPNIDQLGLLSLSWAQWLTDPVPPGLLHLKWIEPRHMQHQIRRWDASHADEIDAAFFNGSGILVWENVFGSFNPWRVEDRARWRHASRILRLFRGHFASEAWVPFVPTLRDGVFAHRWEGSAGEDATVWTLRNMGESVADAPLIEVDAREGVAWVDAWNARPARVEAAGAGRVRVVADCGRIGCIAAVPAGSAEALLRRLGPAPGVAISPAEDPRNHVRPVVEAERAPGGQAVRRASAAIPAGMVKVPGGRYRFRVEHIRRECGCYPDPGAAPERWGPDFLLGSDFQGRIRHDTGPIEIAPFLMDEAEVSNAEFKRFLDESGYRPAVAENFLKHWTGGKMPPELADHPVVYVDLDDARAYARWAGKRLPTEWEWQLAAQGADGRMWPWGEAFDAARCNIGGRGTMPVRSLPEGRSPFGCYHMSGNVWELTESCRNDGHTRFLMLRGGGWFRASGSIWYADGGPQSCGYHSKFIRMWPGLDRSATIGFRCVVSLRPE